ncbi:DUF2062 domain-containing protein [Zunongwangia sp. F260]|uniref:DUF2062 domain-containing protein n=1 Tax=Autumnicola lenta TaxID=3075593 RepID=A0ABU3CFF2_9FLAO|nr:DUF2062 domain-containing protein [Zunongwangia sp. F260]MDT0645082.1 DUF2062 domain-containing protein [Zunongwangia sp. F260]
MLKMKTLIAKIKSLKIFTLSGSPESIAKGFALGSFIGMMPVPGFQVFIALFFSSSLGVNKKAACLAVFNTNAITGVFIFAFNYWLGKTLLGIDNDFIFPNQIDFSFFKIILLAGKDVMLSLLMGGLVTGLSSSLIIYYGILRYYKRKLKIHGDI